MNRTDLRHELATPQEVADFRRTTVAQLARERHYGTGPKFVKSGGKVLYRWAEVHRWLASRERSRTGLL